MALVSSFDFQGPDTGEPADPDKSVLMKDCFISGNARKARGSQLGCGFIRAFLHARAFSARASGVVTLVEAHRFEVIFPGIGHGRIA